MGVLKICHNCTILGTLRTIYDQHDLDEMCLIEIKELADILGYRNWDKFYHMVCQGKGFEDGLKQLQGDKNKSYITYIRGIYETR